MAPCAATMAETASVIEAMSRNMLSRSFGSASRSERRRNRVSGVRRSWLIASSIWVRSLTSERTRLRMSFSASATCEISRGPSALNASPSPADCPKDRAAEAIDDKGAVIDRSA